jgi:TonB family protein
MHPILLLESDRSYLRLAEYALASVVAHFGVVLSAVVVTHDAPKIPTDERDARVFFLLPPDRVDVRMRQTEEIQWGKLGGDLEDGKYLTVPGEGRSWDLPTYGARGKRGKSGARGEAPFGPAPSLVPDSVFSVLEVDEMVERYAWSAAPVYPSELIALGTEGAVRAIYVVDTLGRVDTTTIEVLESDDSLFTESVRTALGQMRFRPARRAGTPVRQRVEQKFRFRIAPITQAADPTS